MLKLKYCQLLVLINIINYFEKVVINLENKKLISLINYKIFNL